MVSSEIRLPIEKVFIQAARAGVYVFVIALAVVYHLFQGGFFSWEVYRNFYLIATLGLLGPVLTLPVLDWFFSQRILLALSFVLDIALISALLLTSQLNQSLFLFLYILIIILGGLTFQTRGAVVFALLAALMSTFVLLLGDEVKSISFFFLLLLNNVAFFSVAWISGFLSEQLEMQGLNISDLRKLNESIVETVPSGLVTVLENGEIVRFNSGASEILGAGVEVGLDIRKFFPEPTFLVWPLVLRKEIRREHQGADQILVLRMRPQVFMDQKTFLLVIEDETQVRRLEFAVKQSEKLAAVGTLAAGIAHEIRNPLAGISGSIELLSQNFTDRDDQKLTRIILKEIDRLNNLISEFLDFAKPDKPPDETVDLSEMLTFLVGQMKLDAGLRQDVETVTKIEAGCLILGHRDKLKQAFLNMLINSYQAMATTERARLEVLCYDSNNQIKVEIIDTGMGMDAKVKSRMFEPFLTTKPKGTGLGLAITHKILETHYAQLFVESQVGAGTRITIEFPASLNSR